MYVKLNIRLYCIYHIIVYINTMFHNNHNDQLNILYLHEVKFERWFRLL